MSSTHLDLIYHLVFSTKERRPWIEEFWEKRLHSYLAGIICGLGGISKEIGGAADHVHIEVSLKATHCLADVMREIKTNSSRWIHSAIGERRFGWQDGYGAFTVSRSDVEALRQYIQEQKEHHRKKTFQEEYLDLLRRSGIQFDETYLW
jgi:putative transposase